MQTFSRKKIRGHNRKLQQLDDWKNSILKFPSDKFGFNPGQIFRLHLSPFHCFGYINLQGKFHRHLYKAYNEILKGLKDNQTIKDKGLIVQLWLFYPRTIRSLVIVAPKDKYDKRNSQVNAKDTNDNPPRLIRQSFKNKNWKIGEDNNFSMADQNSDEPIWLTHRQGDIWITE